MKASVEQVACRCCGGWFRSTRGSPSWLDRVCAGCYGRALLWRGRLGPSVWVPAGGGLQLDPGFIDAWLEAGCP